VPDVFARLSEALADRYALDRELGEGGMATVYLAEDSRHRRKVAIKVLRPDLAAVIGAERFLNNLQPFTRDRVTRCWSLVTCVLEFAVSYSLKCRSLR
jgi:serine/threonine protein kinase